MEIRMNFNEWSKDKLRRGIKWSTSRPAKYGDVGDTFSVSEIGKAYKILGHIHLPLWMIIEYLFKVEGASSPNELKQVWKTIHPSFDYEKDRDALEYVHFFREIPLVQPKEPREPSVASAIIGYREKPQLARMLVGA